MQYISARMVQITVFFKSVVSQNEKSEYKLDHHPKGHTKVWQNEIKKAVAVTFFSHSELKKIYIKSYHHRITTNSFLQVYLKGISLTICI